MSWSIAEVSWKIRLLPEEEEFMYPSIMPVTICMLEEYIYMTSDPLPGVDTTVDAQSVDHDTHNYVLGGENLLR